MISGGIEVNQFALIRLILDAKFGYDPLRHWKNKLCNASLVTKEYN